MTAAQRSIVLGTAGHIDHGKTSLVRALTGQDTDRLPEEKRRGITIELGFAPWKVSKDIEASIVDVPGHEAFVRAMIAGAGGLDAVVFVISAEDGVMPQTREHLNICTLLGLRHAVVALTKIDCIDDDPDAIELAIDDVRETLLGTPFEQAPIMPCSSHSGAGIDELRAAIIRLIRKIPRPNHKASPILPIDRIFSLKGHGTVVTGTLQTGEINLERDNSLTLMPVGSNRKIQSVRARTMQVRNKEVHRSVAGTRTSLNLPGLQVEDLSRGDILTRGPRVVSTQTIHAFVRHLGFSKTPWSNGTTLQLCAGTAHAIARIDPLQTAQDQAAFNAKSFLDTSKIEPGGVGLVRLHLDSPTPVWRDQKLILRAFSDSAATSHGLTVGGGEVIDPSPIEGRGQRSRWIRLTQALLEHDLQQRVLALLEDSGSAGMTRNELIVRGGIDDIEAVVSILVQNGSIASLSGERFVFKKVLDGLSRTIVSHVDQYHAQNPMHMGLSRAAALGVLPHRTADPIAIEAIETAIRAGQLRIADDSGSLARPGKGILQADKLPKQLQQVLEVYRRRGKTTATIRDIQDECNINNKQALEYVGLLQRSQLLVKVSADLSYTQEIHQQILDEVKQHLKTAGQIDVQALKQITSLSRKFVVPLLEHLDQLGITYRRGDTRFPGPNAK